MNKKHIPIFLAADDRYLPYLAVTLKSISNHSRDEYLYEVHILSCDIPRDRLRRLFDMDLPNLTVKTVNLDKRIHNIRRELHLRLRDYYSESIYYRLFIPSMFPSLHRAIYIDCDVVLTRDIAELYFTDMGDALLGAVTDESITDVPEFCDYVKRWVGVSRENYFNSGVLIMNLDRMREEKIEEKFLYLLGKYNFDTVAPDQDYLNRLCRGRVYYLDGIWNKQPRGVCPPACELGLIHYNMFNKPWRYPDIPYAKEFWRVARETPFYGEIRAGFENYSDGQIRADREGAWKLVSRAAELAQSPFGFEEAIPRDFDEKFLFSPV